MLHKSHPAPFEDTMKRLKTLLETAYKIQEIDDNSCVIQGTEQYIKYVAISLHYNFLGIKSINMSYSATMPFHEQITEVYEVILPGSFTTEVDFLTRLAIKEKLANTTITLLISEYNARLAQYSLFNPDTQETT